MSGNESAVNTENPLDIPKELWMMVDHLFRSALKQVRQLTVEKSINMIFNIT